MLTSKQKNAKLQVTSATKNESSRFFVRTGLYLIHSFIHAPSQKTQIPSPFICPNLKMRLHLRMHPTAKILVCLCFEETVWTKITSLAHSNHSYIITVQVCKNTNNLTYQHDGVLLQYRRGIWFFEARNIVKIQVICS